ncbi:MAG: hypothetical protein ABIE74_10215, partial [Pseudomonadota bacterium]
EFYSFKDKSITLTVEYSDIPGLARTLGGRGEIYKKTKDGFLKSVNGETISFNDITVAGSQGKELIYKTPTRTGKTILVMVKKRLFVIQSSAMKETKDKSPLDKFLNSFAPLQTKK